MARRKKVKWIGKAHPRLFKYLTIFGATLGVVSGTAFSVCMSIDAVKGDVITEDVREYEISFSNEGSLIAKNTYKRGEEFVPPENPTHSLDGESNYFFIGWDTNGNGIPDFVPPRAYYSFNAEAVYFRTGKFDMSLLDLLNMSPEDLMKLLQDLNIDWEQFMSMFNLSLEDLLEFLKGTAILTYETVPGDSSFPVYFRSTSFGNFDYKKMAFNAPDFYDSGNIDNNSVNPLSFTSYKLKRLEEMGMLPHGFGFTEYDITYNCAQDYYPIPECSYGDDLNEYSNSDAHYEVEPIDNQLTAYSAYCPAFGYVIDLFKMIPLSGAVARDEKDYYRYALEHYTEVPEQYYDVLDDMIYDPDNNWYEDTNGNELWQVDSIAAYVSKLGTCNVFGQDGGLDFASLAGNKQATFDPINTLLQKGEGSPYDFNATATLLFRRLNIPARLVKGYVGFPGSPLGNTITLYNEHYWCEIYVAGTGWMICDCIDPSAVTGENPYEQLDKQNTPLQNKHILDRITVRQPSTTEYYIGDEFNMADGYLTAYFQDGEQQRLYFTSQGVTVTGFDSTSVGPVKVTISYTYEGVTKTDSFYVNIKDKTNKLVRVDFDLSAATVEYYQGQNLNTANIVATARYQDGTEKDVSPIVTYNGYHKDILGYQEVTVGLYNDETADLADYLKSTTYSVTVYRKRVDSITFEEPPMTKTTYYQGDEVDYKGLKYYFTYYDGTREVGKDADISGPSSYDMTVLGMHPVTVTYYNEKPGDPAVSASFNIEVTTNNMTDLTITNYKNSYMVGEIFDSYAFLQDATITVNYQHTDPVTLTANDITIYSSPDLLHAGDTSCLVKYINGSGEEISVTLPVNVYAGGGQINIKYNTSNMSNFTYDGNSHFGSIDYEVVTPTDFPSHLQVNIGLMPNGKVDDGTTIWLFNYVPYIISITNEYGQNVAGEYSYTIGEGASGISYFVSTRSASVTIAPQLTSYKPDEEVICDATQVSGLAAGDEVVLSNNSTYFDRAGTFDNYNTVVSIMRGDKDVTGCYRLNIERKEVEIRD